MHIVTLFAIRNVVLTVFRDISRLGRILLPPSGTLRGIENWFEKYLGFKVFVIVETQTSAF